MLIGHIISSYRYLFFYSCISVEEYSFQEYASKGFLLFARISIICIRHAVGPSVFLFCVGQREDILSGCHAAGNRAVEVGTHFVELEEVEILTFGIKIFAILQVECFEPFLFVDK